MSAAIVETERLALRELRQSDLDFLSELLGDPEVMRYWPRPYSREEAAFAVGLDVLKDKGDIDRIDYRPKSNVFKVLSKRGYKEVQVDGKTGKVLQVADRVDQLSEDIHDLSFFADWLHRYWLPCVATLLFGLACTGVVIFFTPVVRRIRFRRSQREDLGE